MHGLGDTHLKFIHLCRYFNFVWNGRLCIQLVCSLKFAFEFEYEKKKLQNSNN